MGSESQREIESRPPKHQPAESWSGRVWECIKAVNEYEKYMKVEAALWVIVEAYRAKHKAETAVKVLETAIPFSWVNETLDNMKNSRTNAEFAIYAVSFCALAGVDAWTTAADVASLGRTVAATAPVKAGMRAGTRAAEKLVLGFVERGIPDDIARKSVEKFIDLVRRKGPEIVEELSRVRSIMPFKDESKMWTYATQELLKGTKNLDRALVEEGVHTLAKTGVPVKLVVADAGATWLKNHMGKEFGDIGLAIYTRAAAETSKELGASAVRMGGDEIVSVFVGASAGMAKKYDDILREKMVKYAQEVGVPRQLMWIFEKFSTHEVGATAKFVGGKAVFSHENVYVSLNALVRVAQTKDLFKKLSKESVEALAPVAKLRASAILPQAEAATGVFEHSVTFRLNFNKKISTAIEEAAKLEGKMVAEAEKNVAGPSLINLFSYDATNLFTEKAYRALELSFEKHGIPLIPYQDGALTFSFKNIGKVPKKELGLAIDEARAALGKELKEYGVTGTLSFADASKELASFKVAQYVMGRELPQEEYDLLKAIVWGLHVVPDGVLADKTIDLSAKEALAAVRNAVTWLRLPEHLQYYLEQHYGAEAAKDIMTKLLK